MSSLDRSHSVEQVIGPIVIGTFLNTFFFGLVIFQYSSYLNTGFRDRIWTKILVGTMCGVDIIHTILMIYQVWDYCLKNDGRGTGMDGYQPVYFSTPFCVALSGFIAQGILAQRIDGLSKNWLIFTPLLVGSLAAFSMGITCMATAIGSEVSLREMMSRPYYFSGVYAIFNSWLSVQLVTNLTFAGLLFQSLLKRKFTLRRGDSVLMHMLHGLLQTGVIMAVFSVLPLAGFAANPVVNVYALFIIPMGRIYSITAMDTLLGRDVPVSPTASRGGFIRHSPQSIEES